MKRKIWICALVCALTAVFCVGIAAVQYQYNGSSDRYIDHIVNADTDPGLGAAAIPEDRMVGADFVSHLPLVVIDTGGQEIVNYKRFSAETSSYEVPEGIDPYFTMQIRVYDSENHCNRPSDEASLSSAGRIKVRGNSSAAPTLPKFQYTLKLETEDGEEQPLCMMGIGTDDTWILNPTVHDKSRIRNYLAYNIAGQLEASTPDLRYCEVLFAKEDGYYYGGLYMMCESVKVSPERVNIQKDATGYQVGNGYLICRDRYSESKVILDTWGTRAGYNTDTEGTTNKAIRTFLSLEYPKNEAATPEFIASVEQEISEIEMALYGEKGYSQSEINKMMDMDSFAEYMIINEFFCNYDAGHHSTYMYKSPYGKLTAGPYWDYDGAMDNWNTALLNSETFTLWGYPWFEKLIRMEDFEERVEKRYRELRNTILSDEYLADFIDGTVSYLGNALLREDSAYGDYSYITDVITEEGTGLPVDRRRESAAAEAQRIKDVLLLRGEFMDKNINTLQGFVEYRYNAASANTVLAVFLILAFLVSTVLARRYRQIR